mgnify:CR=1 FL=1
MNEPEYDVGDLVLALKKYGYDSPHYEWITGLSLPHEYAIITKIIIADDSFAKFYVRFTDNTRDCMSEDEIKIVAKCNKKFPATIAASPLNII